MLQVYYPKINTTNLQTTKSKIFTYENKEILFKSQFNSNSKALDFKLCPNNINFCGSTKFKSSNNTQIGTINHQTAFFREPDTDEFVQNYIRENFSSNPKIKIVSGACSNGDEAKSYSMMLDDLSDKIEISGFDIDDDIVAEANNSTSAHIIKYPKESITALGSENILFDRNRSLTQYQQACKDKFNEYYSIDKGVRTYIYPEASKQLQELEETLSDQNKLKQAKTDYIRQMAELKKNFPGIPTPDLSFEEILSMQIKALEKHSKMYNTIFDCHPKKQIKNCNFIQGDIMNLSEIYPPNSVDVLLYRNALYHTLCTGDNMYRIMRQDSVENMNKIASQMNKVLNLNGLVVFGEDEIRQGINTNKIADIMRKNGFEPVINSKIELQNVWRKVKILMHKL